jgi:hypothetical protein
MEMKLMTSVGAALVLVYISATMASASIGIGVAPANFTIADAFKGGTYEQMIKIFNTGDEAGTFTLSAEGDAAAWISYYNESAPDIPLTELAIPGKGNAPVLVKIAIPKEIANADYTATIYAQSVPKMEETGGAVAHAVVRIPANVLIRVTGTQILKGTVKSITVADTEIEYPLKIKIEFRNEGNVIAKPAIHVTLTKNGALVDHFVHDETGVKPGAEGVITVLWNTTGRATGEYLAAVNVSLGDEQLAKQTLPFKVLPFGALTRRGELHLLIIEGEPLVNIVVKFIAQFENTGEIDTMAKFKGELYREGQLLEVLESDERFIETGETGELATYYKIQEHGTYTLKGRVLYSGKETAEKDISFEVPEVEAQGQPSTTASTKTPGFDEEFTLIAIVVVSIGLWARRVRRRERKT